MCCREDSEFDELLMAAGVLTPKDSIGKLERVVSESYLAPRSNSLE